MKLILQFARRRWVLCAATIILLILDVMGGLFIPTLAAEMLNLGTSGATFEKLLETGIKMAAYSVASGVCGILGGYTCAVLAFRIGKDIRTALYEAAHAGAHQLCHCAPALYNQRCRHDFVYGAGQYYRAGQPRGAFGKRRSLCRTI